LPCFASMLRASRRDDAIARGLARPVSPDLPGLPGRDAGDRRVGSGRFASGTGYLVSGVNRGKARSPA